MSKKERTNKMNNLTTTWENTNYKLTDGEHTITFTAQDMENFARTW